VIDLSRSCPLVVSRLWSFNQSEVLSLLPWGESSDSDTL
jgi:hypothetical protein